MILGEQASRLDHSENIDCTVVGNSEILDMANKRWTCQIIM